MKVIFYRRDLFTFQFCSKHFPTVIGKRMSLITTVGKSSLFHITAQWWEHFRATRVTTTPLLTKIDFPIAGAVWELSDETKQ